MERNQRKPQTRAAPTVTRNPSSQAGAEHSEFSARPLRPLGRTDTVPDPAAARRATDAMPGLPRDAEGPVNVEPNEELGMERRVCAPIRCHGHLLGFLWLIDREAAMTFR